MHSHVKKLLALAFASAAVLACQAQTNLVESLDFHLVAFKQGNPTTTKNAVNQNIQSLRIGTSDVIGLLGAATGNTFSSSARLLRVTPILNGAKGQASIIVRDVTMGVDTNVVDVTGFFTSSVVGGTVLSNTVSGRGFFNLETALAIRSISLEDNPSYTPLTAHFSLQGTAISSVVPVTAIPGLVVNGYNSFWTVAGTGNQGATPLVIGTSLFGEDSAVTLTFVKIAVGPGYSPAPIILD